jgi:sugar (pentulose or hexulose) kinase
MTSETTGTVLAAVCCAGGLIDCPETGIFQGPAFRARLYYRMAFGDVSARYLQWYRDQLPDRPSFEELSAEAAAVPPGADGVRLRTNTPLSPCGRGAGGEGFDPHRLFEGFSSHHTRGHAVRAIIEAVALALRDQVAALTGGERIREIRSAGGPARSPVWLQIKADVLGVDVVATECPEPTSLGAAILAEAAITGAQVEDVARDWVRLRPAYRK